MTGRRGSPLLRSARPRPDASPQLEEPPPMNIRTPRIALALLLLGLGVASTVSAATVARASFSRPASISRPAATTVYRPAPAPAAAPLTSAATSSNRPAVTAPAKPSVPAEAPAAAVSAAPAPAVVHTREVRTESSSSSWLIPWLLFSNSSHSAPAPAPAPAVAPAPAQVSGAVAVPSTGGQSQELAPCQKADQPSWLDRLMSEKPAGKPCEKEETSGNRF